MIKKSTIPVVIFTAIQLYYSTTYSRNYVVTPENAYLQIDITDFKYKSPSINLDLTRFYREFDFSTDTTLGGGWILSFERRLLLSPDGNSLVLYWPSGKRELFSKIIARKKTEPINYFKSDTGEAFVLKNEIRIKRGDAEEVYNLDGGLKSLIAGVQTADFKWQSGKLTKVLVNDRLVYNFIYEGHLLKEVAYSFEHPTEGKKQYSLAYSYRDGLLSGVGQSEEYVYDQKKRLATFKIENDSVKLERQGQKVKKIFSSLYGEESIDLANGQFTKKYADNTSEKIEDIVGGYRYTDRNNRSWDYLFEAGRLNKIIGPDKTKTKIEYDKFGNVTLLTPEKGIKRIFEYNDKNLVSRSDIGGSVTKFQYDNLNRLILTERNGQITKLKYDENSRPVQISSDGEVLQYTYEGLSRLPSQITEKNRTWKIKYDENLKLKTMENASDRIDFNAFKKAVNANVEQSESGRKIKLNSGIEVTLDSKNYPIAVKYLSGAEQTYKWGPYGELTESCRENCEKRIYDDYGRLVQKKFTDGKDIQYLRDEFGRAVEMKSADEKLNFTYNSENVLSQHKSKTVAVKNKLSRGKYAEIEYDFLTPDKFDIEYKIGFDKDGLPTSVEIGDFKGQFKFNTKEFVSLTADKGSTLGASKVVSIPAQNKFDSSENLTQFVQEKNSLSYSYDESGFRNRKVFNGKTENFQADTWGRIVKAGENEITWSSKGEMLTHGESRFSYDSFGRLISASGKNGTVKYGYDSQGLLVYREYEGNKEFFIWYAGHLAAVADKEGKVKKVFAFTGSLDRYAGHFVAENISGKLSFKPLSYVYNERGDVVDVMDASGNKIQSFTWGPFGEKIEHFGTSNEAFLGYKSAINDPVTGLVFMRYRVYNPDLGVFLTPDPIPGNIENIKQLNPYLFALNNPIVFSDPLGLSPLSEKQKYIKEQHGMFDSVGVQTGISYEQLVFVKEKVLKPINPWSSQEEFLQDVASPFMGGISNPLNGVTNLTETLFDTVVGAPAGFIPDGAKGYLGNLAKGLNLGNHIYTAGKAVMSTVEGSYMMIQGHSHQDDNLFLEGAVKTAEGGIDAGGGLAFGAAYSIAAPKAAALAAGSTALACGLIATASTAAVKGAFREGVYYLEAKSIEKEVNKIKDLSVLATTKSFTDKINKALAENDLDGAENLRNRLFDYGLKTESVAAMNLAVNIAKDIIDPAYERRAELERMESRKVSDPTQKQETSQAANDENTQSMSKQKILAVGHDQVVATEQKLMVENQNSLNSDQTLAWRIQNQTYQQYLADLQQEAEGRKAVQQGMQSLVQGLMHVQQQTQAYDRQVDAQIKQQNANMKAVAQAGMTNSAGPSNYSAPAGYPTLDPMQAKYGHLVNKNNAYSNPDQIGTPTQVGAVQTHQSPVLSTAATSVQANSPDQQDNNFAMPLGATRSGDMIILCQRFVITSRQGKKDSPTDNNTPLMYRGVSPMIAVTRTPCEARLGEVYSSEVVYKNNKYYTQPQSAAEAQRTLRVVEESEGVIQVKPDGLPEQLHYQEIKSRRR